MQEEDVIITYKITIMDHDAIIDVDINDENLNENYDYELVL